VFLGSLTARTGAHLAIQVARRTGRPLRIITPTVNEADGYFKLLIRPYLADSLITIAVGLTLHERRVLLAQAQALIYPVGWDDPVARPALEAMACGTPTLALSRGAIPEVVEDEVTGFACDSLDGLIRRVNDASLIDRTACLARVLSQFSIARMVEAYEALYLESRSENT